MKIMDIHSHSWYSDCGNDDPRLVIHAAIKGGIELYGLTDHNYGIGTRKQAYYKELTGYKEEYKNDITMLCGIEISTLPNLFDVKPNELAAFDYCLIEHIDHDVSLAAEDAISFIKALGIKAGIAHTDLFSLAAHKGIDPLEFLKAFAEKDIFWEMNVNYDSIHGYREHAYVAKLFSDEEQQDIVRRSGIRISVGFDGHRIKDYSPERIISGCKTVEALGFSTADEYLLN